MLSQLEKAVNTCEGVEGDSAPLKITSNISEMYCLTVSKSPFLQVGPTFLAHSLGTTAEGGTTFDLTFDFDI